MGYPSDLGIREALARGTFQKSFIMTAGKVVYTEFTTTTDSGLKETPYPVQTRVPQLRRGVQEMQGLRNIPYTVTYGEPYRAFLEVPKEDFEHDQIGVTKTYTSQFATRVVNLFQQESYGVIANGIIASGANQVNGYDSLPLYSLVHNLRGNGDTAHDQANLYDWTGKSNRIDFTTDDFETQVFKFQSQYALAKAAVRNFKDSDGKPWYENAEQIQFVITCSPDLEDVILTATGAEVINATTNIQFRRAPLKVNRVLVSSYLNTNSDGTDTTGWWHLHVVNGPGMKSVMLQRFKATKDSDMPDGVGAGGTGPSLNAVEFQSILRDGAQISFQTMKTDNYYFAARVKIEPRPGLWQATFLNQKAAFAT